jgi:hypothetical protein
MRFGRTLGQDGTIRSGAYTADERLLRQKLASLLFYVWMPSDALKLLQRETCFPWEIIDVKVRVD